jgi:hypothetical protein
MYLVKSAKRKEPELYPAFLVKEHISHVMRKRKHTVILSNNKTLIMKKDKIELEINRIDSFPPTQNG